MSNETSTKEATTFPKQNWGWILIILSVLADTLTLIQWLQGSKALSTVVFLVIFTSGLWLSLFYVYFKKRKTGGLYVDASSSEPRPVKKPLYPEWVRRLAFYGIFAIPILTTISLAGWEIYQNLPSDKTIILIADFDGPDSKNYGVTEIIIEKLRDVTRASTKKHNDVEVHGLGETITAQQGSDFARKKGKERKASIVLWGWYRKTEKEVYVTAHFEILRSPRYLPLRQEKETLKMAVAELDSFDIQIQLSSEMSYLALLTIGLARYEANDYDGAITYFTNACAQKAVPEEMINPAILYFYRGNAFSFKSEFDSAIVDYGRYIKIKPKYTAYINRGNVYYLKGDLDHSINDYNQAIKLEPKLAETYNNRAIVYNYRKVGLDSVIADFNYAINLKPDYAEAYCNRGITYLTNSDYEHAFLDFDYAIKLKPDLSEAYSGRGLVYINKDKIDHALNDFDQAIKLKPDDFGIYTNRGNVHNLKGRYNRAIEDFNHAIKTKPDFAEAYNNRGNAYGNKGDFERAIADYNYALKLKPDYAEAYHNRGYTHKAKGEHDRAIDDFNQAIKLKSDYTEAYIHRALAYYEKNDYDLAIDDCN